MNRLAGIALLCCAAALAGCASTEFQPWEGRANVYEGRGGTKVIVDGMEIWEGEPPRKYSLVGVLKDERPGGPLPMSMLRGDMVKKAREQGGTALINMGGSTQFVGTAATSSGTAIQSGNSMRVVASGSSVAILRKANTFAIIRYLD